MKPIVQTTKKMMRALLLGMMTMGVAAAYGQQFTGHVTDATGAELPKVSILVHNMKTNVDLRTATTASGDYTVPYLRPGMYAVTAAKSGFRKETRTDITLQTGQTATLDFSLQVGEVSETVTVRTDQALLDRNKADRGEVVENTRITELPLNGRDPNMLSILSAGVTWTGYIGYQRPFDDTQANLSINGGGSGNNALLLDGVSNESAAGGGGTTLAANSKEAYVPPVDAVEEFKIITNPYDALYGRASGGAVDMTLKSGTNKLHGDVYEFARRTWLDANTWQNDYLAATAQNPSEYARAPHKLDQYGVEVDGPVFIPKVYDGRNRSFFVVQYENWNEVSPNSLVASVPDPAWATGDFSNLTWWDGSKYAPITIYDPLTLHDDGTGKLVRNPFPGNKIPQARMNQTALKIMSYYPKPNVAPPPASNPFANNYATPNPTTDRYRNVLGKWDETIGSSDRMFLRYGYWERIETRSTNGMPAPISEGQLPHGERSHSFGFDWVHTFTPRLLLDVRGSVSVRKDYTFDGPSGYNPTDLGWPAEQVGQFGSSGSNHFPQVQPSEFAYAGNSGGEVVVGNGINLLPTVTWIKGKHTVHAGVDLRLLQQAKPSAPAGPNLWFDRQWTQSNYIGSQWTSDSGNSFASMLLGTATSGTETINPQTFFSQHYYAPFVQDDWKVTPRLTLNLGVRWDLNGPQTERHNQVDYAFDPNMVNPVDAQVNHALMPNGMQVKGGVQFAGVNGNPRGYYALYKTAIQPRVGLAYSIDNQTVFRVGFGEMFRNPTPGGNTLGYSATTTYDASYDGGKTPLMNFSSPFPNVVQPLGSAGGALTSLGQGPYFINPKYQPPSFWAYSLGFEHQFSKSDTLEMSYVGSRLYNLDSSDNINHPSAAAYARCNVEMGGNHHLCDDAAGSYVPNPFQGIQPFQGSGYYNASTIQAINFSRPLPAFTDVIEYQLNGGKTWYNALQVTGMHRWGQSLTLHATWTWAKLMDAGGWKDEVYRIPSRTLDANDRTHRITLSAVYMLPVGRGRAFLGHANRLVDTAIGGWELGSLYIYETGVPWVVPGNPNEEYVGSALVQRHTLSNGYIRGVAPCVALRDPDTGALTLQPYAVSYGCTKPNFIQEAPYAANPNTVYTGIRIPSDQQFDANLSKNFAIWETMKLQFRLEAFNVLNHPLWQIQYAGSANDANFGTIERGPTGQSNLPRQMQIALKLMW